MNSRRQFIKLSFFSLAGLSLPLGYACHGRWRSEVRPPRPVRRGLVIWFSQTGNTQRIGRLLAAGWRKQGLEVTSAEIRKFDPQSAVGFDLIAMGCPVNHYDAPGFVKSWLARLPHLQETPVAAFITHGLPPSNQHNTACAVLEILAQRGGVPVGLATFGNFGTYPPAWAFYPQSALKSSGFPNERTYEQARNYGAELLVRVRSGMAFEFKRELSFGDVKKNLSPIWFSKLITDEHTIDKDRCWNCGTCTDICPTGAIDPAKGSVNKVLCVDCMGCINNCPAQAVRMVYWGKPLVGYPFFLQQHGIIVREPVEIIQGKFQQGMIG